MKPARGCLVADDFLLTRAARKKLRRKAAALSLAYVESMVVGGLDGGFARIEHPVARRIVRSEIYRMLREDCRPRTRRLSPQEAIRFPFMSKPVKGSDAWLAVGLDFEGRATISLRWLPEVARGDSELAHCFKLWLLSQLSAERRRSGIAMDSVSGSA